MRKFIAFLIAIPLLVFGAAVPANAATVKGSFDYHIGDTFLQQAVGAPVGDQAIAENGVVATIVGTGTFDTVQKTASGSGTFAQHNPATGRTFTGTFVTTGFISFDSYGNGTPQGLPASFFGGKLMINILATPDNRPNLHVPVILTVECELGSPPGGAVEGVRVNVLDIINFNKSVVGSGATVFVLK